MHWLFGFCFVVHLNAVLLGVPFAPSIVSEDLVRLHSVFCSWISMLRNDPPWPDSVFALGFVVVHLNAFRWVPFAPSIALCVLLMNFNAQERPFHRDLLLFLLWEYAQKMFLFCVIWMQFGSPFCPLNCLRRPCDCTPSPWPDSNLLFLLWEFAQKDCDCCRQWRPWWDCCGKPFCTLFCSCWIHSQISIIALVRLKPDAGSKSQKLKSLWGGQILDCNCCKFDSQALKLLKFSSLNSRKKKFEVLYYHELELNREKHSVNAQPDSNRAVCCQITAFVQNYPSPTLRRRQCLDYRNFLG